MLLFLRRFILRRELGWVKEKLWIWTIIVLSVGRLSWMMFIEKGSINKEGEAMMIFEGCICLCIQGLELHMNLEIW